MRATEIKAARTILDEGVPLEVATPSLFRLFGKKVFTLRVTQPKAGTGLRITVLRLKMGISDEDFDTMTIEDALRHQVKHTDTVARIVALVLLRGRLRGWLFSRLLGYYLRENCHYKTLLNIMQIVTLDNGLEDFLTIIRLTELLILTEPNLSQETQRS